MVDNQVIREITRLLKEEGALKVILFGSYAAGNAVEGSDLDLHHRFNSRMKSYRSFIPIDLLVYTRAMFEKATVSPNLFFREIQNKGIILYEASN